MNTEVRAGAPNPTQPTAAVRPPAASGSPTAAELAGLSEAEAERRLAQYGENALAEHP